MLIALIFLYMATLGVVIYLTTVEDPFKKIEWVREDLISQIQSLREMCLQHDREILMYKRRLRASKLGYEECSDSYSGNRVYVDQLGQVHNVEFVKGLGWCYENTGSLVPITFRKKPTTKKQPKKKA